MTSAILLAAIPIWGVLGPPPPPPAPVADPEALYEAGDRAYWLGDFTRAIEKFEVAYEASQMPAILYNVGLAYMRRFELSGDSRDLLRAKAVLRNFGIELERDSSLGNAENLRRLLTQIDDLLSKAPAVPPPPAPVRVDTPPPAVEPSWTTTSKPWKGMMIGGSALIGLGIGAAILAGFGGHRASSLESEFEADMCSAFTPTRPCADLLSRGRAANTMTIVGAVAAPLTLGGGIAMMVVGARRRGAARHGMTPMIAPRFVGLSLHVRF